VEGIRLIEYVRLGQILGRTPNSYSRNQSFAQNARRGIVENHHHQNHSDSPASEPLIEHTDDEFKVRLTNINICNNYGDLVKVFCDVLIECLSYLLSLSVSAGVHLLLKDVVVWIRKDCGLVVTDQDIKNPVDRYMRDRLEISNDVIFTCSKQWQGKGVDWCDSLKQNAVENLWLKHGMSEKACAAHERPELAVNVIGSAVGVSVNMVGRPTTLDAVAAEFMPSSTHRQQTNSSWCAAAFLLGSKNRSTNSSRCELFLANMTAMNGGHPASQGAVVHENSQGHGFPVGGCI